MISRMSVYFRVAVAANRIALRERQVTTSTNNNTCVFCKIQAHIPVYVSIVGAVTCVREEQYDWYLSLNHRNTLPPKWRPPHGNKRTCLERVTMGVLL